MSESVARLVSAVEAGAISGVGGATTVVLSACLTVDR